MSILDDSLSKVLFGKTKSSAIREGVCLSCKGEIYSRNEEHEKQYENTGLCPLCFEQMVMMANRAGLG